MSVLTTLFSGASSYMRRNGTQVLAGNPGAQAIAGATLGTVFNGSTTWVVMGDSATVVVCNPSITDAQRGAMETAINAYWAVY
jgi:hypothetical protein